MAKKQLSAAVAEKYKLVKVEPGKHHFADFGIIDLTNLSLEYADELVSLGFPYLESKKKSDTAATKP
jgi:hypothetical protein